VLSRRGFIQSALAVGGAGNAALAQVGGGAPVIGVLSLATVASHVREFRSFREGLRERGYVDGQTIRIEERYADGDRTRLPELLDDILRRGAALVVTPGPSVARAIRRLAPRMPVIAVALPSSRRYPDLFEQLARPGGNVTGFSHIGPDLAAKRVEILKEAVPGLTAVGVLYAKNDPLYLEYAAETEKAARARELRPVALPISSPSPDELAALVSSARDAGAGAAVVIRDYITETLRHEIFAATTQARIAGLGEQMAYAEAGALVSYGASIPDLFRRAAEYVDRILKGANPAELPIQLPTRFELVLNLKTAGALGLMMPQALLASADDLIE
jgi:ABC-type uncharacterized transport system substrate-binding protein